MIKTIHRYELGNVINEVKMPDDAVVLSCGWWKGEICVWAQHTVRSDQPPNYGVRRFQICGTGHEGELPPNVRCVGVVLIPESALCFHVFEEVPP